MTAKEQLERLSKIQKLALEIREARRVISEAPGRIDEIEGRFRDRNTEYVELKERHDALEADQRERNGELQLLEEARKKYTDDLMQVQNQREYAAMLKEIDEVKARISEHEEAVIAGMEELETLKEELSGRAEHIEKERELVASERAQVESDVAEAKATIARATEQRTVIEAELPSHIAKAARRIEGGRAGVFLATAADAVCLACHVRIRPQMFQEVRTFAKVHTCPSCKRFLYFDDPAEASSDVDETPSGGSVEAPEAADGIRASHHGPAV